MIELAKQELSNILKDRISFAEGTRANYARGEDTYDPILSLSLIHI